MKKKCDVCGRKIEIKTWQDDMQIHGVSPRCSERVWQVCKFCLADVIAYLDENKNMRPHNNNASFTFDVILEDGYEICTTHSII